MHTSKSLTYVARVDQEGDCILITFPDLPEANTFVMVGQESEKGWTAMDCLRTALDSRARDRETYPAPEFKGRGSKGRLVITISRTMLQRSSDQP